MSSFPIVGSHYRPPAKALIAGISNGTKLFLRAEPQNAFDPNAIQILLHPSDIEESSYQTLNDELSGYGQDMDDINQQSEWHLGYIPKEIAKILRETNIVPLDVEIEGNYLIDFRGKPLVEISE